MQSAQSTKSDGVVARKKGCELDTSGQQASGGVVAEAARKLEDPDRLRAAHEYLLGLGGTVDLGADAFFASVEQRDRPRDQVVRIRGDGALSYQKIIDVLSLAKAKGLTKAALDTETR